MPRLERQPWSGAPRERAGEGGLRVRRVARGGLLLALLLGAPAGAGDGGLPGALEHLQMQHALRRVEAELERLRRDQELQRALERLRLEQLLDRLRLPAPCPLVSPATPCP